YGDGFGWKFLIDATLTATRIRGNPLEEIVVLTTDLMLAGEDSANEARFFSQTVEALGTQQTPRVPRISLVFVEVVGSYSCSVGGAGASDPLTGWNGLQRLREVAKDRGRAFALDLIDNTAAMFDSQLRCWLRDSSPRQACSLRLPATETFSGVVIEVEMTHYLLDQSRVLPRSSSGSPASLLHKGFSNMKVVQGVRLDTLDQGLCRGDPLLCIPSRIQGSRQQSQANRKLFMAVCAELNERDMGLLLSLRHPSTSLEERWLLLPQTPPQDPAAPAAAALGAPRAQQGGPADAMPVDRGLLIRLATKEEVLEEGEAVETNVNSISNVASELSVERAAASASLEVLDTGTYNPLKHSSGLFELLASQRHQPQQGRTSTSGTAAAAPKTARAASNTGAGVDGMSANRRLGCEPDRQQQQQQQQQKPQKHRRHQSSPSLSSATLPPSSSSSSIPRRATIGGLGRRTKEGARGTSQHQQQQRQPAKIREVSLRFAETPQRQQQKQRQSGRGKSPTTGGGDAGVRVGGGGGEVGGNRGSKSESAVLTAVTSGGRPSKRSGAPQGWRRKAKGSGREREGGARDRG
ncbi:unnamed protein product, partial [Ectocarpus sp. 13 AM-2016]